MEIKPDIHIGQIYSRITVPDLGDVTAFEWLGDHSIMASAKPLDIFLFCVKEGELNIAASFIPHPLELHAGEAVFLANPRQAWDFQLSSLTDVSFNIICMESGHFHRMLNPSFDESHLQDAPRINMRDLMRILPVSPSTLICFDQLFHSQLHPPFRHVFEKAKLMEIISTILENAFGQAVESCPVAMSPVIEQKLAMVRRHIMEHVDEVPDVDRLALQYDLPRTTLKEGYRFQYGKTLHQYHSDHKLEYAYQILSRGEMLVKEVAYKIGYQNPSHFIAAFKKKYGFTPKQYLKRERRTV